MVSTVVSKQGRPEGSFLNAPVTAWRIRAALSGETTERVVRKLGTLAIRGSWKVVEFGAGLVRTLQGVLNQGMKFQKSSRAIIQRCLWFGVIRRSCSS